MYLASVEKLMYTLWIVIKENEGKVTLKVPWAQRNSLKFIIYHTQSLSLWILMTSFSLDNPEAQALLLFRMVKYFTFYIYF